MSSKIDQAMDESFMRMAIEVARRGITAGQSPFGSCIVDAAGKVIACEHNIVWQATDPTAHAEVTAIRAACGAVQSIDLSGCSIYSTTEPCPMCFSSIHWARIGRIVYGASIADAQAAGFSELTLSNVQLAQMGGARMEISAGVLGREAAALFAEWKKHPKHRAY